MDQISRRNNFIEQGKNEAAQRCAAQTVDKLGVGCYGECKIFCVNLLD